ncbi:TetR/AcrR family transcriptional regulator [Roseateles sp. BYS96W]|uniref:TetR/AcrR family transcriptional regulator n=1 Tax=Pelomonas nitida TaxID=3299027 RepID=A0ABW7G1E9_9BURK
MSSRLSDSRQRVVGAAAEMLAQHGLNATSIREMAKRAEAPLGSTYHHFPGGKQQVVCEAVAMAGARVQRQLEEHLRGGLEPGLQGFLALWRQSLLRSDFRIGCPIMAAAVEEPIDGEAVGILSAAAEVFEQWKTLLATALQTHGHTSEGAAGLATLIIAGVEGAIVMCRAERSIDAFDKVAGQLQVLCRLAGGLSKLR